MKKSVITQDGMKKLPLFPETYQLLRAANYNAYDYYGLMAGTVLEVNALDPDSEYAKMIVDLMEKKGALLLGVCRFWGGIDHAYTYGYWMHCLGRNEIKKVLLGFYTSLAYGMTRDTYSAVEVTFIEEGKNFYTLPHSYSNTEQLKLLRNMLISEDGQVLRIARAVPKPWLKDGETISVKDAPTLFGNISYRIDSKIASGKIQVQFNPGSGKRPNGTIIHLRHPEDKPIRSVNLVQGQGNYAIGKDQVRLTDITGPVTIDVLY